ncbi:MAG: hypothetical protein WBA88_27460 [Pseudaminobacter sp.]
MGVFAPKVREFANKAHYLKRDLFRQYDNRVVFRRVGRKPPRKPDRQLGHEQIVGDRRIDHSGAGVEASLDAMAADDRLAESVDGRRRQLIKPGRGGDQRIALLL